MTTVQMWTLGIGLIGAAAWLPHLVTLTIKILRKPKLTATPARSCEIGFTELGPIFNIKTALTAEHESILIDKVEFRILHESGDVHQFRWHEISEVKGQMIVPGVQNQPIHQESEAIAVKILPTDFKDLLFRNRLESHTQGYKKYEYAFNRERRRLINAEQFRSSAFYGSSYVQDMQAFLQSQMIWKKGQYRVEMTVHNRNKAIAELPKLTFQLSDEDIVLLQANCNNMPKLLRNMCLTKQEVEEHFVPLEWHWLSKDVSSVEA
tara:strand:+ start:929 stop:1720 length:792 start_codon:yes stop_codon:yes gene_type:complete